MSLEIKFERENLILLEKFQALNVKFEREDLILLEKFQALENRITRLEFLLLPKAFDLYTLDDFSPKEKDALI